jgi:hypothetical protein
MRPLLHWFSLLPVPVLGAIAVIMYRRKQHRLYPIFWIYICFQLARIIVVNVVFLNTSYSLYFYGYWTASICSVFFTLLLLRSIFVTVLRTSGLKKTRRVGYEVALGILWCIGLVMAIQQTGARTFGDMMTRAEQTVSFTAVGMLLFVVGSSIFLGIKWNPGLSYIAGGLGVLGTVDLLVYTFWRKGTHYGSHTLLVGWIETVTLNAVAAIFAVYFLPLRTEAQVPEPIKPQVVEWLKSMKGAMSK